VQLAAAWAYEELCSAAAAISRRGEPLQRRAAENWQASVGVVCSAGQLAQCSMRHTDRHW
jgi:hypothetical protein